MKFRSKNVETKKGRQDVFEDKRKNVSGKENWWGGLERLPNLLCTRLDPAESELHHRISRGVFVHRLLPLARMGDFGSGMTERRNSSEVSTWRSTAQAYLTGQIQSIRAAFF